MNHKEAVRKHPSTALSSSLVFAAYLCVRLIPRDLSALRLDSHPFRAGSRFRKLAYGHFQPASSTQGCRSACKRRFLVVVLLAGMALAGCAAQTPPAPQVPPLSAPAPSEEKAIPSEEETIPSEEETGPSETPEAGPPPHVVASLQLTDQGRLLLEKGQTDDAIRILERAVNLNPAHGQNYYYLAEAWIRKRNLSQAKEFNRLAGLYLHEDKAWLFRVKAQRGRIEEE